MQKEAKPENKNTKALYTWPLSYLDYKSQRAFQNIACHPPQPPFLQNGFFKKNLFLKCNPATQPGGILKCPCCRAWLCFLTNPPPTLGVTFYVGRYKRVVPISTDAHFLKALHLRMPLCPCRGIKL